ncbi:GntR family transcriptional regulator [Streptomyces sp. KhCrAH-43]|uniref:GntR family transcriptional regulator n=1 Tax=unclassified Streptomyces TaxID=2593676 RepID=UPI00048AC4D7|nr:MULTISPECIES: GntR family transcriptional regulator [unclassified Streptomyces]MYX67398.1 UTRA domain-containing protein [Streptomyces sp. SID8373]RAJ53752.1 GntR family transcriptional regulator [Streptomyces sp. KhCrAH-43]
MANEAKRKQSRHEEIADALRAKIDDGSLAPGEKLPSEKHLLEQYGVSITTMRQALDTLKGEGLIASRQGYGITVREFRPLRRPAVQRLSKEEWLSGKSIWDGDLEDRPWRVDVDVDEAAPPLKVAKLFGLPSDAIMCRRSRRFHVDGRPVQLAVSYLPADLVAGTRITEKDTGPGGLYARLAELGKEPVRFREEVRARMPRPAEAESLALASGTPVLEIVRIAATEEGEVVEVNDMLLDAGSYILDYVFSS